MSCVPGQPWGLSPIWSFSCFHGQCPEPLPWSPLAAVGTDETRENRVLGHVLVHVQAACVPPLIYRLHSYIACMEGTTLTLHIKQMSVCWIEIGSSFYAYSGTWACSTHIMLAQGCTTELFQRCQGSVCDACCLHTARTFISAISLSCSAFCCFSDTSDTFLRSWRVGRKSSVKAHVHLHCVRA